MQLILKSQVLASCSYINVMQECQSGMIVLVEWWNLHDMFFINISNRSFSGLFKGLLKLRSVHPSPSFHSEKQWYVLQK